MAVKIRLKRMGKMRSPFYRVVVMDARTKRDGRVIETYASAHVRALVKPFFDDVPQRLAYHEGINLTGSLTGDDWPTLSVGSTAISWTGSVSRITITPNWRTL